MARGDKYCHPQSALADHRNNLTAAAIRGALGNGIRESGKRRLRANGSQEKSGSEDELFHRLSVLNHTLWSVPFTIPVLKVEQEQLLGLST